jgi:hypothetical protein
MAVVDNGEMPVEAFTPSVADVSALLRARTKDSTGSEVGTFNDDTRPTSAPDDGVVAGELERVDAGRMDLLGEPVPRHSGGRVRRLQDVRIGEVGGGVAGPLEPRERAERIDRARQRPVAAGTLEREAAGAEPPEDGAGIVAGGRDRQQARAGHLPERGAEGDVELGVAVGVKLVDERQSGTEAVGSRPVRREDAQVAARGRGARGRGRRRGARAPGWQ